MEDGRRLGRQYPKRQPDLGVVESKSLLALISSAIPASTATGLLVLDLGGKRFIVSSKLADIAVFSSISTNRVPQNASLPSSCSSSPVPPLLGHLQDRHCTAGALADGPTLHDQAKYGTA